MNTSSYKRKHEKEVNDLINNLSPAGVYFEQSLRKYSMMLGMALNIPINEIQIAFKVNALALEDIINEKKG